MARLISYPIISTLSLALGDLFPVTDMSAASRPLKNVTVESLTNFVISKSPFAFNATHPTAIQSANNLALGDYSIAMGLSTTASGSTSIAMGLNTTASGPSSIAMVRSATASGFASVAMGEGTEANKISAIAMGSGTTASGNHSTAMGRSTEASGTSSTAMGGGTLASGGFSTAMGNNTTANGEYSTAMGNSTTASGYSSLAIGQYNVINNGDSTNVYAATNTAFSIGNGTSSASRSNALSVLFNGNVTAGSVIATSLEVERTNTDNDITDGISIDLTKTSSGTGYSTRARGINIEVENSGTAETYSTTGVKSLSKYSGAGNAYFLSGIVSTTTNEGSGDLSAFYGMYTTLNSNGTGVQDVDYMIGNTIAMNFNNPNLDVNRVGCINAQLYFKAATTINTEAYVMLLDTDFDGVTGTDVTVNGDFSYLFIKPHTAAGVPTVTGTARAINSESTLPSVFAGSVGSAGMNNSAIAEHTDNAAAITAGLSVGTHYRTGDLLKIVH